MFLSDDSVFNTPKSLKQLSLTDFPGLNKAISKIPKKSKKLTKTPLPLSYAYMTKKYLPVKTQQSLFKSQSHNKNENENEKIPTFAEITKKNLPIVKPKHIIEAIPIEEWLGRIKMQKYSKFFTEYLNIKYNYEILEIFRTSTIFKFRLEDFIVNKEYNEEYADMRKQYLPKKTKTKHKKNIEATDPINMYITTRDLIKFIYKHGNIDFDDQIVLLVNTCRGGERYDVVKSDTFNTLYQISDLHNKVFKKDSYRSRKNSINSMYEMLDDPFKGLYNYHSKYYSK